MPSLRWWELISGITRERASGHMPPILQVGIVLGVGEVGGGVVRNGAWRKQDFTVGIKDKDKID